MKHIKLLTLGADPEVFLQDMTTKEIITSEGIIMGSKYDPYPFEDGSKPGYYTCLDNVATEYAIPPARTANEWIESLQHGMDYINKFVPKGICVAVLPAVNMNEKYLQSYNARTFGCEPDFNAYTMQINNKPVAEDSTLRSCAAHIHLGYDNPPEFSGILEDYTPNAEHAMIVQSADLHLSVPAVLMEEENKRKELYGKAGSYRPKKYGLEYRTISNFYLRSKELMKWAFDCTHQAINSLNNGLRIDQTLQNMIQHTINNNDKKLAEELVKEFNLNVI